MGTPKQLFVAPAYSGWDVTADGMRFLMAVPPGRGLRAQTPITVVLNWQAPEWRPQYTADMQGFWLPMGHR
jgi:poly(3-hydroxybutyrate) depolymerase